MKPHLLKNVLRKSIVIFLVVAFAFSPATPFLKVETTEAQWAVFDGANVTQTTISAIQNSITAVTTAATEIQTWYLQQKETYLDGLLYALMNSILLEMVNEMTNWINSGFDGSPSFISNFDKFLLDMGDKVVGDYIAKDLAFLCSPFKVNIQVALQIQYGRTKQQRFACRLSEIGDNLESFFNGDFITGGWDSWFKITSNPVNNQYGTLLEAQTGITAALSSAKGGQISLNMASGNFLSSQKCKPVDDESGGHEECEIVTPGSVIESQLNQTLDSGRQRIIVADEINEMLGAALSQLVMTALREGLSSFSEDGENGQYFEEMADVDVPPVSSGTMIADALSIEEEYIAVLEEMLVMLDEAAQYKNETYGETNTCHSGELSPALKNMQTAITAKIVQARTTLSVLNALQEENLATTTPEGKLKVSNAFLTLQKNGAIHRESDIARLDMMEKRDLIRAINGVPSENIIGFKPTVDAACQILSGGGGA